MSFRANQSFNVLNVSNVLENYTVRSSYYFPTLGLEAVLFVIATVIAFLSLLKAVKNLSEETLEQEHNEISRKQSKAFLYGQHEEIFTSEQEDESAEAGIQDPHFSIVQDLQQAQNKLVDHLPYHIPGLLMVLTFGMEPGFIVLYLIYASFDALMILRGWAAIYRGLELLPQLLVVGMFVYYLVASQVFIQGSFF